MDVNRTDRLAETMFSDGYILSCGNYFVTGRYTCFLVRRCPVLQSYIQLVTGKGWALCVCMLNYALFVSCGAPNPTKGRC